MKVFPAALATLALVTGGALAQVDVLIVSDWDYLTRFGVKPDNATLKHIDLRQKAHLHYLISDPGIQNRDKEVDYYLDYVTMCPLLLAKAGVSTGDCDSPPPGHP